MSAPRRPSQLKLETGLRLAAVQKALGMPNGVEFARYLDVQPNKLSQWKSGVNMADIVAMVRLADKTAISLDFIYRGDMSGVPQRYQAVLEMHLHDLEAPPAEGGLPLTLNERRARGPAAPRTR
jgi:hypothetical protein